MRTFIRSDLCGSELKTIQEEWDHHGSYQWTYFVENVKQHIDFFLQQRLIGRNLDVGGGWYLSYPNSDVIDVSPVCLEYNIAPPERKYWFDLDSISKRQKLPFEDNCFDSATLVSSWQYLLHPWAVVRELERVLKPGAEIYIINGEGAGLSECVINHTHSKDIIRAFNKRGYDTLVEVIPDSKGGTDGYGCFRSVCVATPCAKGKKGTSHIKNKEQRLQDISDFSPDRFMNQFARAEIDIETEKLKQLNTYPITEYSAELLEKIEALCKDYSQDTNNIPIFFLDGSPQFEFDMALSGNEPFITATVLYGENNAKDIDLQQRGKEYGLKFGHNINYLGTDDITEFRENLGKLGERSIYSDDGDYISKERYIDFLAARKLNSHAQKIEDEIKSALKSFGIKFDKPVKKEIARGLHYEASQYKQRRRIDKLIERKNGILSDPRLISGYRTIELEKYIPYFRSFIIGKNINPQLSLFDF